MAQSLHPFHALLPQHASSLQRRALRLTGNADRADDLVQTTLMKAWASRDSYRPDTQLRNWLFTIMRNTFFSDMRKRKREVEDIDDAMANRITEHPRQEDALALKELMSAIARLPEPQRRPIILMGAYGFSQAEAADACACTVGTVKSRVSRGRETLNQVLDHEATVRVVDGSRSPTRLARSEDLATRPNADLHEPVSANAK